MGVKGKARTGTTWRWEEFWRTSEDSRKLNTSYEEISTTGDFADFDGGLATLDGGSASTVKFNMQENWRDTA